MTIVVANKNLKIISLIILIFSTIELIYFLYFNKLNQSIKRLSFDCYTDYYFLFNSPILIGLIALSILLIIYTLFIKPLFIKEVLIFEFFVFCIKVIFYKDYTIQCGIILTFLGFTYDNFSYYIDLAGVFIRGVLIYYIFLNKKYIFYFYTLLIIALLIILLKLNYI